MTPDPIRRRRIPILYLIAQSIALALGAATWALDMIMTAAERRRAPSGARSGAAQPRRTAMHDAKGRELKMGDIVLIPARITQLYPTQEYCNVSAKSIYGRRPDGAHGTFGAINTGVMLRANPGDENDLADLPTPAVPSAD